MINQMKPHLSRRELTRRMEQGKVAINLLTAVVIEHGGLLTIHADAIEQAPGTRVRPTRDEKTGTITLRVIDEQKRREDAAAQEGPAAAPVRADANVGRKAETDGDDQGPLSNPA